MLVLENTFTLIVLNFFLEPLKSPDEELVTAVGCHSYNYNVTWLTLIIFPLQCLLESISIVDILCSLSRSLIHVVLPVMRKLYSRFAQAPVVNARLLLPLVKFFINHGRSYASGFHRIYDLFWCSVIFFVGDSEMYDSETPISVFFGQVLSAKFNEWAVHSRMIA